MTTNGKRDYYEVLGVGRDASPEDIRKAFRKLAFEHHPDRNRNADAEQRFKEINEAYEVLRDTDRRAAYDRFGHAAVNGQQANGQGFEGFGNFSGFGDIFDAFFGGNAAHSNQGPRRGSDIQQELVITFEEAAFGCEKEIEVTRVDVCARCNGTTAEPGSQTQRCPMCGGRGEIRRAQQSLFGQFVNITTCERCRGEGKIVTSPCQQCKGSGREKNKHRLAVRVPPGVDQGMQIRLSDEGNAGARGGSPGDLYVVLKVQPHEVFLREGLDVVMDLRLNIAQAALGADVSVPTLVGEEQVKVPAGAQTGQTIRLKGKGLSEIRGARLGDQVVRLHVITPDRLNEKQRKLLQDLAQTLPDYTKQVGRDDRTFMDRIKEAFGG